MISRHARVFCSLGILSIFALSGASEARADEVAMSCVFQGAGATKVSWIFDLQKKTVTNSANVTFPILELTDSTVKWHEESPDYKADDELNRISGNLVANMAMGGTAFTWTYACQRVQRQL